MWGFTCSNSPPHRKLGVRASNRLSLFIVLFQLIAGSELAHLARFRPSEGDQHCAPITFQGPSEAQGGLAALTLSKLSKTFGRLKVSTQKKHFPQKALGMQPELSSNCFTRI